MISPTTTEPKEIVTIKPKRFKNKNHISQSPKINEKNKILKERKRHEKEPMEIDGSWMAFCQAGELPDASCFYATTLNGAGGVIIVGLEVIGEEGSKNARPWVLRPEKSSLILGANVPVAKTSPIALLFVVDVAGGAAELVLFVSLLLILPPARAPPTAAPTIAPIKTRITRTTVARPFLVFQNG